MTDNYDYIHQASNQRLAEMVTFVADHYSRVMTHEENETLRESARRLRIPPHRTFHEEYIGEV